MTDHSYGRGQGDGSFTYKTLLVAGMHFMDAFRCHPERSEGSRHFLRSMRGFFASLRMTTSAA